jgi:hypothetical protein
MAASASRTDHRFLWSVEPAESRVPLAVPATAGKNERFLENERFLKAGQKAG